MPLLPLVVAREKLARGERTREVGGEPAVMDEPLGVKEYDEFGACGEISVHNLAARGISRLRPRGGTLLDLGCGTGRLLQRLATGRPDVQIVGLDLSEPMLETGLERLAREGFANRVELRRGDMTTFDAGVPERVDVVSSNFALHHLPDEETTTRCLEAIARTRSRMGSGVWILDFARLRHPATWPGMTSMIDWPGPVVHSDAIESERAAFSAGELTGLLERVGLGDLHHLLSRPLGEYQVHYAPSRDHPEPVTGLWRETPLPRKVRLPAQMVIRSFPRSLTAT